MTVDAARDRLHLGRLGIWTYQLNYQPAAKVAKVVAELEALGYGSLWIGEAVYGSRSRTPGSCSPRPSAW
jgi:hypothetical protein